jgi:hypothetical protein
VVLDFGRVIATGSPADIKANPEVTRAYLGEDASRVGLGAIGSGSDGLDGRGAGA